MKPLSAARNHTLYLSTLTILLVALYGHCFSARAELQVDITRGTSQPMPIAIPEFFGKSAQEKAFGIKLADLISSDLERSGLFRPIDRGAFIQKVSELNVEPSFGDWRQINAQALITGRAQVIEDGRLYTEFRLYDVFREIQVVGLKFKTPPDNWRRVAHIIADEFYKIITGETGYFDTRIVYISETGSAKKRVKRLAIMDQDGANHAFLPVEAELLLTPRFSPTAQKITYLAYDPLPRVYVYDLDTKQRKIIGDWPGMTFAPRFSPDGKSVIMSMAKEGNSEIYSMDLRTQRERRLTRNPAIDTSPSYAPDGRRIVFNSDRGGKKHLYVMNADGSGVQRISRGKGRYSTPVWSPRGDLIAFTRSKGGIFSIGVMQPDGARERLLADGFLVEGPTWAPNGRVLMYTRKERGKGSNPGANRLYSIDLTGYNERRIATPGGASDPAWSPLGK